eukprot:218457-Prymnesium_polylepis.1
MRGLGPALSGGAAAGGECCGRRLRHTPRNQGLALSGSAACGGERCGCEAQQYVRGRGMVAGAPLVATQGAAARLAWLRAGAGVRLVELGR